MSKSGRRAYEVFTAQAVCSTIAELQLQKIKEENHAGGSYTENDCPCKRIFSKRNVSVYGALEGKGSRFSYCLFFVLKKSHLLNCKCDTFVNITSPTQLQDGTTYDSNNIIHHICMKSNKKLFR